LPPPPFKPAGATHHVKSFGSGYGHQRGNVVGGASSTCKSNVMDDLGDIFEVLNLDDLHLDDQIDFNLPPFLESDEEVDSGQYIGGVQEEYMDPYLFLHVTYYSFKRGLGIILLIGAMEE